MSGDILGDEVRTFLEQAGVACLNKPFEIDELKNALWKVIRSA